MKRPDMDLMDTVLWYGLPAIIVWAAVLGVIIITAWVVAVVGQGLGALCLCPP